jgi:membrane-associated phospholipid phosphatase
MNPATVPVDARLFLVVYAAGSGAFTGVALALSAIGSGWAMLGLAPLLAVARWRRCALFLTAALVTSATLVFSLKQLFGRLRPCASLAGVHALCAMPTDPSFPSGHACGSFTVAAFVVLALFAGQAPAERRSLVRILVAVLVTGLATAIAWSRIYLGVHFPGDVTAGALLGISSGALAGWLYRQPAVAQHLAPRA